MWNAPSQKGRGPGKGKTRDRDRFRKGLHFKRIAAQIEIQSANVGPFQANARLVLNDLTSTGVGVYSSISLPVGQEVLLLITDPSPIKLNSKVIWCQEFAANSHILSAQSFSYRLGLEFVLKANEEEDIKRFCEDIFSNYLSVDKVA